MTAITNSFYPGKQEFDVYIASLPKDEKTLSEQDVLSLSNQAAELFTKGIPHRDRSICLYYFYHFLGISFKGSPSSELISQFSSLPGYAVSSLSEPEVLQYIKLLESKKLYEVCQVRGEIKMYSIELVQFVAGKTTKSWDLIASEAESFLASEPCQPQSFLEWYFDGNCLSDNFQSKRYELANKIWESSSVSSSLKSAWQSLNDPEVIRAYKKNSLSPKEAKKIFELEQIEQAIMSEFDGNWHRKNTLGKALQFLSKRGREEQKALDELCIRWVGIIKEPLSFSGNDPYVNGYASFLTAFVRGGTEDFKGAVKELKKALDYNFDPLSVLSIIVTLLDNLKKTDEAANFAQQLIDIMGLLENSQKEDFFQPILSVFEKSRRKPIWANRIWEDKAKENQSKVSSIIEELEPAIENAKKINIEQRIQSGIQLLDNLFSVAKADDALNSNTSLTSISITNSVDEILELSIEEIEPFNQSAINNLKLLYYPSISLENLLNINESVIKYQFADISLNLEQALAAFPNTLSHIPLAKKYIAELLTTGKHDLSRLFADHLCKIRNTKVEGLYDAIRPVQQQYHSQLQFRQEIEFITQSKKLLNEREEKQAIIDLTEAYVDLLSIEKSLNERNRLLKSAELEQLQDERLNKHRVEVDALLYKRKKIVTRAVMILGFTIVLFVVIYVLFIN